MSAAPPSYHEPSQIAQGQTISFTKKLAKYPASAGWSLTYSLRGNGQQISFSSTASVDDHVILVAAATTESWLAGDYQLSGSVINTDGTNEQFYLNSFSITPDLATADGGIDLRTHAQKMLVDIEAQLEQCAKTILLSTTVEGTTILRERRTELLTLRQAYIQERRGEIARESAKNGRPTGRRIKTVLSIMAPGNASQTESGAGNSVFNYNNP